jgi:hypothetical protein
MYVFHGRGGKHESFLILPDFTGVFGLDAESHLSGSGVRVHYVSALEEEGSGCGEKL